MSDLKALALLPSAWGETLAPFLVRIATEWNSFVETLEFGLSTLEIKTEADAAAAANQGKEAAEFIEKVEAWRKTVVGPLNEAVGSINGVVKPYAMRASLVKDAIKSKIGAYQDAVAQQARAEQQKKDREAAEAREDAKRLEAVSPDLAAAKRIEADQKESEGRAAGVATQVNRTAPGFGTASGKMEWVWEVTKLEDVPWNYLKAEVNRAMLNAAAKQQGGPPEIPGIRWREERKVRLT